MKKLLLGDEAIALGAIHAGLGGVYAYPGTPSTEITEYIQGNALAQERGVHSRWCANEKTAMEAALGMSYAGRRALVCMKHVKLQEIQLNFNRAMMFGEDLIVSGVLDGNNFYVEGIDRESEKNSFQSRGSFV